MVAELASVLGEQRSNPGPGPLRLPRRSNLRRDCLWLSSWARPSKCSQEIGKSTGVSVPLNVDFVLDKRLRAVMAAQTRWRRVGEVRWL